MLVLDIREKWAPNSRSLSELGRLVMDHYPFEKVLMTREQFYDFVYLTSLIARPTLLGAPVEIVDA